MVKSALASAAAAAALALLPLGASAHAHEGVGFHVPVAEKRMNAPEFAKLHARFGPPSVQVVHHHPHLDRRQSTAAAHSSSSSAASGAVATSSGVAGAATTTGLSMGTIPIGTTTTPETTSPLPTTYAAGATAPIAGAPTLPSVSINPALWPTLDRTPDVNSTQVQQWIAAIDWTKIPNIPVNQLGGCQNASNAAAVTNASANGWWTCGGHTRSSDVVACPQKNTWGLSYDDGPSPDTPRLLNYLVKENLTSTFFVVGSRAISRPEMLQYEYMAGHQISVHTWEHPFLTTKTNEEIVASLGWTKEAMRQILGVTPNTMRPPYGDIDDRVRAIALAMGLTPIIWTSVNGTSYDTFDWQVAGGVVNADTVVAKFESIIDGASSLDTGFIVLEHDLYQQSTSLAIDYVLPYALAKPGLKLEAIFQCLGQNLSDVYIETAKNATVPTTSTVDRGSVASATSAKPAGAAAAAGSSSAGSTSGASRMVSSSVATVILGAATLLAWQL